MILLDRLGNLSAQTDPLTQLDNAYTRNTYDEPIMTLFLPPVYRLGLKLVACASHIVHSIRSV